MAYEDDEEYPQAVSQSNYGLASNPLMPMGDPLAYARVGAAPETSTPAIHTPGLAPQRIAQPAPVTVPNLSSQHGGSEAPVNQLQPDDGLSSDQGLLGGGAGLQNLLQLKGLETLAAPQSAATALTYTPGGAVAAPGAGAGPGRSPAGASVAAAAKPYQSMVDASSKKYGQDSGLMARMFYQESQFNPNAKSPAGAMGIGQFMPQTAKDEGVDVGDPKSSIDGGIRYYKKMKDMFGDDRLALAAYNWGPGNVQKWLSGKGPPPPPETRNHVQIITGQPLTKPVGNMPSVSAAPMAAEIASAGSGFKPPPGGNAPGFGEAPKPGQMSPHGGPYVSSGGQIYATDGDGRIVGPAVKSITTPTFDKDKTLDKEPATTIAAPASPVSPVVQEFNRPPSAREDVTPGVSPAVQEFNKPPRGPPTATNPLPSGNVVPPPTATTTPTAPSETVPPQSGGTVSSWVPPNVATQVPNIGNNLDMQKLWRFMLIKSLFPQIKFKNINYDPWAVHRYGQGGGY